MLASPLESRFAVATRAGIEHSYLSLAELVNSGFFPADSIGARGKQERQGMLLKVWFAGVDGPVQSDIAGDDYKTLRARGPQRQFFEINSVRPGDQILIEKLGAHEYRFSPVQGEDHNPVRREQLVWTHDELILALDFYFNVGAEAGSPIPGQHTAAIGELSELIKRLGAYPVERQTATYRNANGVYKKLMNLRAVQAGGGHGLRSFGQRDVAIWHEFANDRPKLHGEAEAIRAGLSQGVIRPASTEACVETTEIEQQHTESYEVSPSGASRSAERAEQKLVLEYCGHMNAKGIAVRRKRYYPAGEIRPMYSDAWIEELRVLIEAKASDSRHALRQAIGQLYDYRRFHEHPVRLAVLLPYKPDVDRLDLLRSADIKAIWPHGSGFQDSAGGEFVLATASRRGSGTWSAERAVQVSMPWSAGRSNRAHPDADRHATTSGCCSGRSLKRLTRPSIWGFAATWPSRQTFQEFSVA